MRSARSRLGYSAAVTAAAVLLLASVTAVILAAATKMPQLIAHAERLRALEGFVLYAAFGWTLFGVAVAVLAETGAELRERRFTEPSAPDYRSFYRREANSELLVLVPSFREVQPTVPNQRGKNEWSLHDCRQ